MAYLQIGFIIAAILGSFWLFITVAVIASVALAWIDDKQWSPSEWHLRLPFVDDRQRRWMKENHEAEWLFPSLAIIFVVSFVSIFAWPVTLILAGCFVARSVRRTQKTITAYKQKLDGHIADPDAHRNETSITR